MIKNLLNADEEPPPGTKVIVEETTFNPPVETANVDAPAARETSENPERLEDIKTSEEAQILTEPAETAPLDEESESIETLMAEIEDLEPEDLDRLEREIENFPAARQFAEPVAEEKAETVQPAEAEKASETSAEPETITVNTPESTIFQTDYTPPTTAETIRGSGLAWSAGIVLFGSVVFMMIFGWFADLLLGSSPWGLIGGIVLGGIIGIIQLFRISAQIYRK